MNRQINICDIITAYEYDKLYFMVHKAFSYYFTNESLKKNPRLEKNPCFGEKNLQKVNEFLNDYEYEQNIIKKCKSFDDIQKIRNDFKALKNSTNFIEDAIKFYTEEKSYCYIINRAMRTFDNYPIKLAYFIGPFLFGLNKYILEHPEKCLRKTTTLYRNMNIERLDKHIYTLAVGHIICFPAFTSTSFIRDEFGPSKKKPVKVELIIQYYHSEGNISPGLSIEHLSKFGHEKELLLLPFTFLRLNNVIETEPDKCILEMEIINRKTFIEYELKEGKTFNLEDLEKNPNKPLFIEEGINYNQTNQMNQINQIEQINQPVHHENNGIFYNLIGRWFY